MKKFFTLLALAIFAISYNAVPTFAATPEGLKYGMKDGLKYGLKYGLKNGLVNGEQNGSRNLNNSQISQARANNDYQNSREIRNTQSGEYTQNHNKRYQGMNNAQGEYRNRLYNEEIQKRKSNSTKYQDGLKNGAKMKNGMKNGLQNGQKNQRVNHTRQSHSRR